MPMLKNWYKTLANWVEKVMSEHNRKHNEEADYGLDEILGESVEDKEINNPKRFLQCCPLRFIKDIEQESKNHYIFLYLSHSSIYIKKNKGGSVT